MNYTQLNDLTKKFLVLCEPTNELGNKQTIERIEKHGYCKDLYKHSQQLGYKVIKHELLSPSSTLDQLNRHQSSIIVIEKSVKKDKITNVETLSYTCPVSKKPLEKIGNLYFSEASGSGRAIELYLAPP